MNRLCFGMVFLGLLAANVGSASAQAPSLDQILAYEAVKPADVKAVGTETKGGVMIEDVTFASVGEPTPVQEVWLSEQLGLAVPQSPAASE